MSVTGRADLEGREMLRIPHYQGNRLTHGGGVVGLTHRRRFTRRKI
jgi:hypothetical protein